MKRLLFVLSVVVAAVAVSSCAVGVRGPATEIATTSAVLNGSVVSTAGGSGSYYIEYGPTEARTEATPTRAIEFEANESHPVSEPVEGLEPSTTYHFAVCAEDGENPGEPFCSRDQTFRTDGDIQVTLTRNCSFHPPSHGVDARVTGLQPNATFRGTLEYPSGGTATATLTADADGTYEIQGFLDDSAGTWTATVEWAEETVTEALFVDCAAAPETQ